MRIAIALILLSQAAQDAKFSGPQKGEKTPGFRVFDVGTRAEADYVAEWKGAPTVLVFIHELTRPGAQLMRAIDDTGQIKQARGLKTLFVSLSDDRDGAERKLPQVIKSISLKSPVGISVDGKEGPGAYGLNREVTLTVLVARDNKVAANFALLTPNATDAPKIDAAIDEVLKVPAPPPSGTPDELKAEVLRLREQVLALSEEVARLKLQLARAAAAPQRVMERPGAAERPREDEKLVGLCRQLIQRDATAESLESAVKEIEAYIAGNATLAKQYADILGRIAELKYGNDLGQAAIRKQLEKHRK